MLERLDLHHVGPALRIEMALASRLNLITGDNGLGKSFLLEVAWWALTRTWASYPARPHTGLADQASIHYRHHGEPEVVSRYDLPAQAWSFAAEPPAGSAIAIYARVDGSFSIWDPARNARQRPSQRPTPDRPSAYHFNSVEVWDGLERDGKWVCNGLIRDWASWQGRENDSFHNLRRALKRLSPDEVEPFDIGPLTRISLDDARDIPTLHTAYDPEMPIVLASAAVKRILILAYLLVWTWQEHVQASRLLQQPVSRRIVFLVDELESHLHPRWQRTILRSLLAVMSALTGAEQVDCQFLAVTHSPLLLASVEPYFDPTRDALWILDSSNDGIGLRREEWRRRGDANTWLISDIFNLQEPRSLEAEQAIETATQLMNHDHAPNEQIAAVQHNLAATLPDVDPFWVRWRYWMLTSGAAP